MPQKNIKSQWTLVKSVYKKQELQKVNDAKLYNISEMIERQCEVLTTEILKKKTKYLLLDKIRSVKGSDSLFVQMESKSVTLEAFEMLSKAELNYAFLWAAFIGNLEYMKALRSIGADLHCTASDNSYNALHLSTMSGSYECTRYLVTEGLNINTIVNGLTPLHYAVLGNAVDVARFLIDAGCKVMDTTLHAAMSADSLECLCLLMFVGVDVNAKDDDGMTALHLGTERGHIQCLSVLLSSPHINVNIQNDHDGYSALHYAAEEGYAKCIELLLQKGADVNLVSNQKKTALHFSSKYQYLDCVEILLKYGAMVNMLDMDNKTAVHMAMSKSKYSIGVIKLLVDYDADVNIADKFGFTPLHIAALNELSECVEYLILKGANVAAKTLGGVSALNIINRKTPTIFASAMTIRLNASLAYTTQQTLKFSFRDIISNSDVGEVGFLYQLTVEGKSSILQHPLCRAFLHLKWEKIRRFYLFRVFLIMAMTFLYSFCVIVETCMCSDIQKNESNLNESSTATNASNINESSIANDAQCSIIGLPITIELMRTLYFILFVFNTLHCILILFSFAGYSSVKHYISNLRNIVLWFTIISSFIITTFKNCTVPKEFMAVTVLISWIFLMMRVGQLPFFGTYIAMYTSVQKQFAKLIVAYLCLLAGFTSSFCVIFPTVTHFNNPLTAFVKVVAMMTGELDIDDLTSEVSTEGTMFQATIYIVFLSFVIFVTVILMNLLVGIAVNNVEELQKSAGLMILEQQTTLVYFMELACFHGYFTKRVSNFIQDLVYVSPNSYKVVIYVRPFSPEEKRLPRDIMADGLKAALERKKVETNIQDNIDKRIDKLEDQIVVLQNMITKLTKQYDGTNQNNQTGEKGRVESAPGDDLSYMTLDEVDEDEVPVSSSQPKTRYNKEGIIGVINLYKAKQNENKIDN